MVNLNSRTQQKLMEGQSSENVPVVSGLPQGSVRALSCFLFPFNLLSYGVASGSEIMPCNKIDKTLVVDIFT